MVDGSNGYKLESHLHSPHHVSNRAERVRLCLLLNAHWRIVVRASFIPEQLGLRVT